MTYSYDLYQQSQHCIPGGVNSPVRAFKGVGGEPLFIESAKGAYVTDVDGKNYVDYVGSWGPMIVGHAHPEVLNAIQNQMQKGLSFGAPTEIELKLAKKIMQFMPSIEKIRMVSSGTEATMSALRLARGYTGRNKFIKFAGCYHGHADSLLVQAGSGLLTCGEPDSAGVTSAVASDTLIAEFNQLDTVHALFEKYGKEIAAVIVEPVAGNMNCVLPVKDFLEGLRALCDHYDSVLIFDEVMTGFRVGLGGAQERYNIKPDLTTLGKVIGGGMPVGAFGGKKAIMDCLAPLGKVYQAGTLSGNPIAMTAGLATLDLISQEKFYISLEQKTQQLLQGMQERMQAANVPFIATHCGGMFGFYFHQGPVETYADVMQSDVNQFKKFFHAMLAEGIYLAPSAFEAGFISSMHGEKELQKTFAAVEKVLQL